MQGSAPDLKGELKRVRVPQPQLNYQCIPIGVPTASARHLPPGAAVEQICRLSATIFAIKAGSSVYTWSRTSGDWGLFFDSAHESVNLPPNFKLTSFEGEDEAHACVYWEGPHPQRWDRFQIIKINLRDRFEGITPGVLRRIPAKAILFALLSPSKAVYASQRNKGGGFKLSVWDFGTDKTMPIAKGWSLLAEPVRLFPVSDDYVLFGTFDTDDELLAKVDKEGSPFLRPTGDGLLFDVNVPRNLSYPGIDTTRIVYGGGRAPCFRLFGVGHYGQKWSWEPFIASFGPEVVTNTMGWNGPLRSKKVAITPSHVHLWSFEGLGGSGGDSSMYCVKGRSVSSEASIRFAEAFKGRFFAVDDRGAHIGHPAFPRYDQGDLTISGLLHPRLCSRTELISATDTGQRLQIWRLSTVGFPTTAQANLALIPNGVIERRDGKEYLVTGTLLPFIQQLLRLDGVPEELTETIDLTEEHLPRAREIFDHTCHLLAGRCWDSVEGAKRDLLATMMHHFQADMQLAIYTRLMSSKDQLDPSLIEFLFLHTSNIQFFKFPYTLACISFKQAVEKGDKTDRAAIRSIIFGAFAMAAERYSTSGDAAEKEQARNIFFQALKSAEKKSMIAATHVGTLLSRWDHCDILHDPAILTMQDQIKQLQRAVDVNRDNIARVAKEVRALKRAMAAQAKRNLVFGVAKLGLTYFGGKIVELIQNIVDFSDVFALGEAILEASPELVGKLLEYGEEELQDAIVDKILSPLGDPEGDFVQRRLELLRLKQKPGFRSRMVHSGPASAPGLGALLEVGGLELSQVHKWYHVRGCSLHVQLNARHSCAEGARFDVFCNGKDRGARTRAVTFVGESFSMLVQQESIKTSYSSTGREFRVVTDNQMDSALVRQTFERFGMKLEASNSSRSPKGRPSRRKSHGKRESKG